jgi:SnoaL-like domain
MSDSQAIADRVEIEALRGEFTDAGMLRDYDRFASLFTADAVWRIPAVDVEFAGREEIRAGIERLEEGLWNYLRRARGRGPVSGHHAADRRTAAGCRRHPAVGLTAPGRPYGRIDIAGAMTPTMSILWSLAEWRLPVLRLER